MSDRLIAALQNPDIFDHPVSEFQLFETHISWVLLTGEFAYKIKKPMNFGFLDFTELPKRKFYCEEEIRLNKRLAPDLYLGVVGITGTDEHPTLNGEGEPFEYAVKMRQFDPTARVDQLPPDSEEMEDSLDHLAQQIAGFHLNQAATATTDSEFGLPEVVYAPVQQNFEQIQEMIDDPTEKMQVEQIAGWAESTFKRLEHLFSRRKKDGFIREGHGDLHLGNVTIYDGVVTPFDCIEFNEHFRWIDVINDLAFLIMDLQDRGWEQLGYRVLNTYLENTGDYEGLALLPFYLSYRAMVRCKIALFTLNAPGISEEMKAEETGKYRRYLDLADSYMQVPVRFLLITHGLSGTGKTTVSTHLMQHLCAVRIRSDVERKRMHGITALESSQSELDGGIYTEQAHQDTYQRLHDIAEMLLHDGYGVILDATFLKAEQRRLMESLAEEQGVSFCIVDCTAPVAELEARLERRHAAGNDAAEADVNVLHKQMESCEPLTEAEQCHAFRLSSDDLEAIDKLADELYARLH